MTLIDLIEEWKDIEGYEEYYSVSNFGYVFDYVKNDYVDVVTYKSGSKIYQKVNLNYFNPQQQIALHTLVAKYFLPNYVKGSPIYHIDEDTSNNRIDNLYQPASIKSIETESGYMNYEQPRFTDTRFFNDKTFQSIGLNKKQAQQFVKKQLKEFKCQRFKTEEARNKYVIEKYHEYQLTGKVKYRKQSLDDY